MEREDWLIDEDGDELLDGNGEYVSGPSNQQEAWECVQTLKGEVGQFPTAGFGIVYRVRKRAGAIGLRETPEKFISELKTELERDNQEDPQIIINNDLSVFEVKVS